jgi:hypothetical protein
MNVAYDCKVCKRHGVITLPETEHVIINIEKWLPLLTCNRCADYLTDRRSCLERIQKVCVALIGLRLDPPKVEAMGRLEQGARNKLTELTKKFTTIICEHFHKQNYWDVEFVNLLMDHPDNFWNICRDYTKFISKSPSPYTTEQ